MRILVWHGWLLEGSGSSVYTARIVETWRREGHDVLLVCQERHPERFPFLDAWATDPASLPEPAAGRAVLYRPEIGDLLPVFVHDEYEGFRVKTFVDLTDEELASYLEANVTALAAAAARHRSEVIVAGHAIPGPVIARRALGEGTYIAKIHGSDLEYAMRPQPRYVELAREGLGGAITVAGASRNVLDRLVELVPSVSDRARVVAPGVEVERFRPLPRREALLRTADLLASDPALARGRPDALDAEVRASTNEVGTLDRLATRYDQTAPDPGAPERLRALAEAGGPLVGYLGKLIPQKGVEHLLGALALLQPRPRALVVGFGSHRERLQALVAALDAGDREALAALRPPLELAPHEVAAAAGIAAGVTFTGRLDHRYASTVVAALDVLVVPSILDEAFGMVALEGAAAGAIPLVARHSGLAEIADALEDALRAPGLCSYEPGPGAERHLAAALERLLAIPAEERTALGRKLASLVTDRWSWDHTARGLLGAAGPTLVPGTAVEVRLVKPASSEVRYPGVVIRDDGTHMVVEAAWTLPARELGFATFEPGDVFIEHYWRDRWYAVKEVRTASGERKGWYCDATRPAVIRGRAVISEDLILDLWASADRKTILRLDEDELAASGLDETAARRAHEALDELEALAGRGFADLEPPHEGPGT